MEDQAIGRQTMIRRWQESGKTLYESSAYPGVAVEIEARYSHATPEWFAQRRIIFEIERAVVVIEDLTTAPTFEVWQTETAELSQPGASLIEPIIGPSEPSEPLPDYLEELPQKKWPGEGFKRRYRDIPTAYLHTVTGEGVFLDTRISAGPRPALAEVLKALPSVVERVYLVGPRPGREETAESLYLWLRQPEVSTDWLITRFLPDDDVPNLHLRHRQQPERVVQIVRAAQWFGAGRYSPEQAQGAMQALERILQATFDWKVKCLSTPGLTGIALWDRSRKAIYPVVDEEMQVLIRSTTTQGRSEITPLPDRDPLPAFVYLDGRFMYAALTKGIGLGPVEHDEIPEFDPHRRGRYRVTYRVPEDWKHIGLLPEKSGHSREPWSYRCEPGYEGETWVGSPELNLALHPPRGLSPWPIEIKERLLFQNAVKGTPWPLDLWGERLIEARQSVGRRINEGEFNQSIGELIESALRNILLHGIGGFHRRSRADTVVVYPDEGYENIPANADPTFHPDGTATYKVYRPLSEWSARLMHPEFSAQVWDRCRTHLLYSARKSKGKIIPGSETGALLLNRSEIVGMRTDALYLTRNPEWPDDGQTPGQFRVKGQINEPCPQPVQGGRGHKLLNQLRERSRQNWLKSSSLLLEDDSH